MFIKKFGMILILILVAGLLFFFSYSKKEEEVLYESPQKYIGNNAFSLAFSPKELNEHVIEEAIKRQKEEERQAMIQAYGLHLSTYPLDIDSREFQLIKRLIEIAQSEPEIAEDEKGVTKYGTYFHEPRAEWCTEFVLWCEIQAEEEVYPEEEIDLYPRYTNSDMCIYYYHLKKTYFKRETIIPRAGDMIFFDTNSDGYTDHTGLITYIEKDDETGGIQIHTIEGNIPGDRPSNCIREKVYPASDPHILGFGTFIPEQENSE